jgi:hypothetical protein
MKGGSIVVVVVVVMMGVEERDVEAVICLLGSIVQVALSDDFE